MSGNKTPVLNQECSKKESETVSREGARSIVKVLSLPIVAGAVMTVPSYALSRLRASEPVIAAINWAGVTELLKNSTKIYPTVTSKQVSRSMTAEVASSSSVKAEISETLEITEAAESKSQPSTSIYNPIAIAVISESALSGLTGMIQVKSTGKGLQPTVSNLEAIKLTLHGSMKFTPHTCSWTALASLANVAGIALLAPKVKELSSQLTDNPTAQTLISLLVSSSVVSGMTTPINTIGGQYLKKVKVDQVGWKLTLKSTQSLIATTQNVMKAGIKQGLKTLFKPYPLTVGMTFLAYGSIEIVNHAVDALLPDQPKVIDITTPSEAQEKTETPEPREDSVGFVNTGTPEIKAAAQETVISKTLGWLDSGYQSVTRFFTAIQERNAQVEVAASRSSLSVSEDAGSSDWTRESPTPEPREDFTSCSSFVFNNDHQEASPTEEIPEQPKCNFME